MDGFWRLAEDLAEFNEAVVPVEPTGSPGGASEFLAGIGEGGFEGIEETAGGDTVIPLDVGFNEIQAVFRVAGGDGDGEFEEGLGFALVADAGEAGGFVVKEAEIAVGAGVVEFLIEAAGGFEFAFHLTDDAECTKPFSASELAEVHAEEIMGGSGIGPGGDQGAARSDAKVGDIGALGVVGGEFGPIETGLAEVPVEVGRRGICG